MVGKILKMICQVRTDNMIDHSLKFVNNLEINSRSIRAEVAALFNVRTNGRFVKMDSGKKNSQG